MKLKIPFLQKLLRGFFGFGAVAGCLVADEFDNLRLLCFGSAVNACASISNRKVQFFLEGIIRLS